MKKNYLITDPYTHLIKTNDLNHKGDSVHFDSEPQRKLGKIFAKKFNKIKYSQ